MNKIFSMSGTNFQVYHYPPQILQLSYDPLKLHHKHHDGINIKHQWQVYVVFLAEKIPAATLQLLMTPPTSTLEGSQDH